MLLLNENDINPEVKKILNDILGQLTEISSVVKNNALKEQKDFQNVLDFCDKILKNDNPILFLETFFTKNDSWRASENIERLASLLSLGTKDISTIETQYDIKYPRKMNVTKKDVDLLNEILDFSLVQDIKNMPSLKAINLVKSEHCYLNLTNHLMKLCKPKYDNDNSYSNFIKKLQSRVLNNSKVSIDYFNKYFNLSPIDVKLDEIEKVSGLAVFSSILKKNKPEEYFTKMMDTDKLEQINLKEALKMGITFNLKDAEYYHFFKLGESVYPLYKNRPVIDATIENLYQKAIVGKKGYSEISTDLSIRMDRLKTESFGRTVLDYESLQKIRTAMFLKRPKWSVGSVLKNDNCYYYISNDLKANENGNFIMEAVVINLEHKTEYFIRNDISINKDNYKNFELADKVDCLLFFEAVNSAFQYAEIQKSNNELYQTMRKRF